MISTNDFGLQALSNESGEDSQHGSGQIIYKGWLKWNVTAARDEIEVKTGNSRVNAAGHYLVPLGEC
ncbi:hypothetical protein Tco_0015712 [Tanacetum coccineum]